MLELTSAALASAVVWLAMTVATRSDTLPCQPRDDLAQTLLDKWGETSLFTGLAADQKAELEIFARPDGTWTAIVITPDGKACPVASGDLWQGFMIPQGRAG